MSDDFVFDDDKGKSYLMSDTSYSFHITLIESFYIVIV